MITTTVSIQRDALSSKRGGYRTETGNREWRIFKKETSEKVKEMM
jgi:hypothetical protein